MSITPQELLEEIVKAQTDYATIIRKTLSLPRYHMAVKQGILNPQDYFNEIVRESDLEHIGHLPLLATMIHPHLENRDKVDLGQALLYLALHEAPERIVGDVLHEDKNQDYHDSELAAARELYSGHYHHYFEFYEDFHFIRNFSARFAHSIDRLAATVYYELHHPQTRIPRWQELGLTVEKIKNTKKDMVWDKTLEDLFDHIVAEIDRQNSEYSKKNN